MKVYTKAGDKGETGLLGNLRVQKDHLRIQAYGDLDELNAIVGMSVSQKSLPHELQICFERIQSELFQVGTELATPKGKKAMISFIEHSDVERLEQEIDKMEESLVPLKNFILPGGVHAAAWLHLARTVCRRTERQLISLHTKEPVRAEVLEYLNRLSDYFFVCARFVNMKNNHDDVPWIAPKKS